MNEHREAPELVEQVLLDWVYPERKRMAALLEAASVSEEDIRDTIRRLTEAASATLGVERTSVWRLRADGSAIDCVDLYCGTPRTHESGMVIEASTAPRYFRALATETVIAAHDAAEDPRTSEFRSTYLGPLGIVSMLDAPVFIRGKATAVICHEHVGTPRTWQFWEELVASTFADLVAMALEAESRAQETVKRQAYQQGLERLVAERTEALGESEKNLQALLDAVPVALVLTRAADHSVSYANSRALGLFEVTPEEMGSLNATNFWVDPAEQQGFLSTLFSKGKVDDLEVQLRSRKGRVFWARMNAQAVRFRGELSLLGGMAEVTEQRQARKNLAEVFASAPVAMVLSRLSDGVLLDGNARAEALFGTKVSEARGLPAYDFWVDASAREELRAAVRASGKVEGFEAELRTTTGARFWAELSAAVVEIDGEPALLVGGNDITERRRATDSLKKRELTVRTLLGAAPGPLVVTRLSDGVLLYCNEPAAQMFELSVEECIGRRAPDFYVDAEDRREFIESLRRDGFVEAFTARLRAKSGRPLWALMNARTFELEGEAVFMVGFADLTQQKSLEEQLRTLATTDALTGAFNRRHFFELGAAEFERATRYGHEVSLAMLDIDHFKSVNDELGHAAGDRALSDLVTAVRSEARVVDVVARIGGEEFALLLPETGLEAAGAMAERVRRAVTARSRAADHGTPGPRLTVSIGVAARRPEETLAEVLRRADEGLYEAKRAGRDRVIVAR